MIDEESLCKYWRKNKVFQEQDEKNKDNKTYYFYDGPPFMTGSPHYGHLLAGFIKDTVTRHFNSQGYNVPRVSGIDCIAEGTLITLHDGIKLPIEELKCFTDIAVETFNTEKNMFTREKMTNFIEKGSRECIELIFKDKSTLTCTPDHKILTNKGWMKANDIKLNQTIIIKKDIFPTVLNINSKKMYIPDYENKVTSIKSVGLKKVYDITVENTHNFLANNVVVHNCHGLPIEYEIEKKLGIKTTQQVLEFGIDNYNRECKNIVLTCKDEWDNMMTRMGRWIDFENGYKTMSKDFMNSVWWVFSELYKKNRIYEGFKVMPYSTTCGTPLSNFEKGQNYKEINDDSLYLKFKVLNTETKQLWCNNQENCYFVVWTTTPWTLPNNYNLAINKDMNYSTIPYWNKDTNSKELLIVVDEKIEEIKTFLKLNEGPKTIHGLKGEELVGLKYEPLFDFNNLHNDFRVIHADYVSNKSGTGIVHLNPVHGDEDQKACLENGIITKESKLFITLDVNGFVNDSIPELKGMFYKNFGDKSKEDLNTWVIKKLKEKGLYLLKKTIKHEYPFCWRSDTPLIYKAVSSYFVKVEDMCDRLVELNKEINWMPKHVGEKRFASWIGNTRDWNVSRNRFWGTPIPIWKAEDGSEICISSSYELETLLNLPENSITDLHRDKIDDFVIIKDGKEYKRIEFTMDCWFESGSMPYASLSNIGIIELLRNSEVGIKRDINNYPYIKTKDNKIHKILPADFIAEGIDQTRGWFYTLLVLSTLLFDMIPFKNVIVNGTLLAENGEKMSKRLKNYPDPLKVIEKYGSDALRLYLLASPASTGESLKFTENDVHNIVKDTMVRIKNGCLQFFKEYTKLFYEKTNKRPLSSLIITQSYKTYKNAINLWFLKKYEQYRNDYFKHMNNYNLRGGITTLLKLIEDINNGYVKIGRYLFKGNDGENNCKESLNTLYFIFTFMSNDFKAICPFLCEYINMELNEIAKLYSNEHIDDANSLADESIHLNQYGIYPVLSEDQIRTANEFDTIFEIIKGIHRIRSKNNKNAKKPIKNIYLYGECVNTIKEEYFDYIYEECNVLNINKVDNSCLNITKKLVLVKSLFFKKYGKEITKTLEELNKKNNEELEDIIKNKQFNNFEIDESLFNIDYIITFLDKQEQLDNKEIKLEEIKINNQPTFVIGDIKHDENTDKLYYAKLFATKVQRMRKNAGLHPWNKIKVYWEGKPKYEFNEEIMQIINKTVKMQVQSYIKEENENNIFYKEECEKTGLNILFERID